MSYFLKNRIPQFALFLRRRTVALFFFLLCIAALAISEQNSLADSSGGQGVASAGGAGQTIRNITVELRDVFDGPNLGGFYQTVNSLKVSTKEEVIRRELLFKSGDKYDNFILQESERRLRALPFLRQAKIISVPDQDFMDIIVSVQDTWTILPELSISSGGGKNKTSAGVKETNLLGYGKRAEAFYADDEGRQKVEGIYDDTRLFGTFQRFLAAHFQRSDGHRSLFYYGEPFRTLVDPQSWAVTGEEYDLVGRLFDAGNERYIFRHKHQDASAGYTFSHGDPEVLVNRFTGGYEFSKDEFSEATLKDYDDVNVDPLSVSHDPALLADDREFSGPFIAYSQIEPDYIPLNYVDRFERVEDFNLGNEFNSKVQWASQALGSKRDTLLGAISDRIGTRFSPTQFGLGELNAFSRVDRLGISNTLLHTGLRYYNVLGAKYLSDLYMGKHTIAANLSIDYGDDIDKDTEFLLGAGSGLRGYEDRTFTGNKRTVFNLEDRIHLADDILKLMSLGGVVFFDAGGTTTGALSETVGDELYSDIGIGLRLGFPRSSGGSLLRIDLAFPLRDGPDGSKEFEPRLLITGGQLFSDRLRSSSFEPKPQNVETGVEDN